MLQTAYSSEGRARPTCLALCDDGAAWVGFSGAWLDLVGLDGVVRQRVATPAVPQAIAARPDGAATVLCNGRRDVWGQRMRGAQVFDVQRDGATSAPAVIALGPYPVELLVDRSGQRYVSSGLPLYSIVDRTALPVVSAWVTRPRLVPSNDELWVQTSYYLSRVADLAAVARGAARGPVGGINTISATHEFTDYAPRKDGQAWLACLESKSVNRSMIRRMDLGTIDYTRPRPALAEHKIAADIYSLCAAQDGGYFALGSDGLLRRADSDGALQYELRLATAVSTRLQHRLRVSKLVLSSNERFAAGLDAVDGALLRVKLPSA